MVTTPDYHVPRRVVAKDKRTATLTRAHEFWAMLGHTDANLCGFERSIAAAYYWPGMAADILGVINSCGQCVALARNERSQLAAIVSELQAGRI